MQKLIIVPKLISNDSHALFWAEKWTDNGQQRKVYCPPDTSNNLSLTAQHIHRLFKQTEIHDCECSDRCAEQIHSGLQNQSIVIAGCHRTDIIVQQLVSSICGAKLFQPHLDPNQILIIRWYSGSYEITSPPLRLTTPPS